MLIRAEVFVEMPDVDVEVGREEELDNQWDVMRDLSWVCSEQKRLKIVKLRMPDSPEPDVSGTIEFDEV